MNILVDTNVLLALVDSKTDFVSLVQEHYDDAKLFALKQSLAELKAKRPTAFELISNYLRKNSVELVAGEGKADNLILAWAKGRKDRVVLTLDFELKKRLKKAGVQIISLRNNKLF